MKNAFLVLIAVCPHLGDPMDGGQVNLQTLKIPDNVKYSFDCVWQIKSPQKKGTFGVYARVVSMNLEQGKSFSHRLLSKHILFRTSVTL